MDNIIFGQLLLLASFLLLCQLFYQLGLPHISISKLIFQLVVKAGHLLQLFRQLNLVLVDPFFSLPQAKPQVSLPLFEIVDQIIFLEDHFLDLGLSMC